jgi:hypothetical protein
MQIAINDDITKKGMTILRDFVKDITVTRRSKASVRQFIDLAKNDFLIYAGINTIGSTNILDVWTKYRNLLIAWLDTFTKEYEIRAPLGDLPIDYQARVSLLTLILLTRDLVEVHDYVFDGETREIVNTPVINGTNVTLYDVVRFIYSIALWGGEPSGVLSIVSILSSNTKGSLDRGGKWNVILYAPLLASGIMTEDFIHKLANYMAEKKTTKDYRFTTTGLGQAFMKYAAFTPRHSLSTTYYYTAITTFTAISHVQYEVLNHVINNVLNTDIYGTVEYMVYEYSKYADYINPLNGHPDFYAQAYTRGDALRDLATMTFTLINARLELLNKDQELHDRLVSKYIFLMEAPSRLINDTVRTILLVSGRVM